MPKSNVSEIDRAKIKLARQEERTMLKKLGLWRPRRRR